jgi:hypothetical protein
MPELVPRYSMLLFAMSAGLWVWASGSQRLPRINRNGWRGARKTAIWSFAFRTAAKLSEFADKIK